MGKSKKESKIDSELLGVLFSHAMHQDQLLWSRVQFLIAVQGGVLGFGFSFRETIARIITFFIGSLLTFIILTLLMKDELDRDVNLLLKDEIEKYLLPKALQKKLINSGRKAPFIRFSADPPKYLRLFRGRYTIRLVFSLFIILDLLLGIFLIIDPKILAMK